MKCLGMDRAESGVLQPPACPTCRVLYKIQCQQQWDHFRGFDVMICWDESELELEINAIEVPTPAFNLLPQPPVIRSSLLSETLVSSADDDNISSVSGISASHRSPPPTSLCQYFLLVMTSAAGRVGPSPLASTQINNLIQGASTAVGRLKSLATVSSTHV